MTLTYSEHRDAIQAVQRAHDAQFTAHEAILRADPKDSTAFQALELDALKKARALTRAESRLALLEARRGLPSPSKTPRGYSLAGARVRSEPLTYEKHHCPNSFFRDLAQWVEANRSDESPAGKRLARHRHELEVEGYRSNTRALGQTTGAGGELIAPIWAVEDWIGFPRASRPIADSLNTQPLTTNKVSLPKVASGAATAVQSDGGTVQNTDLSSTSVTGQAQTVSGSQTASQQLVDLSANGVDVVIFADLTADYDASLEKKIVSNSTTNAKGLLQAAGNSITYTDASPTVPALYKPQANAIAQVHTGRELPANVIAMTPTRWAWILSALDDDHRPLVLPCDARGFNAQALAENVAGESIVGSMMGLPVIADTTIPTALGAGTNEDRILTYRRQDTYLYETPFPSVRVDQQSRSGTLQVVFSLWGYYAIIAERLPKSISVISGTGLTQPSFA